MERELPAVSRLLAHPNTERLLIRFSREYVVQGCRDILDELRHAISQGHTIDPAALQAEAILARLESRLGAADTAGLQRVVNATGTVLHDSLGRALLAQAAADAMLRAATQPVDLEYDLAQGEQGQREQAIEDLLKDLTGAEAATVVNNNAAAVLLVLNTLASGKEVIVSRGEMIEIGGTFGLPGIMARSGASLKEVGTSSSTHPDDYEGAISERTGLLLKLHASDDRSAGPGLPDLVAIGRARGIPVMEDLGSGALIDLSGYGLPKEPVVAERIALGADIVTFSGDKMMGGPQAGLVAGRAALVNHISRNPVHRAVRCGKLTIAALEATLRLYRESAYVVQEIPALRVITRTLVDIEETARRALPALASALGPGFRLSLQDATSQIGSCARAAGDIPTKVIVVEHDFMGAHRIAGRFRQARPPIIGRVKDDWFVLDARAIFDPLDLVPNWTDELM